MKSSEPRSWSSVRTITRLGRGAAQRLPNAPRNRRRMSGGVRRMSNATIRPAMELTHLFFDIGGVLGTNGWDREQRREAAERFGLDDEFQFRHDELVGDWEAGRIRLDDYLDSAVFY